MTPRTTLLVLSLALSGAVQAQTASLVDDLNRGEEPGSSAPGQLMAVGSRLFFTANLQGSASRDFWVTDGTAFGTEALGGCSRFLGTDGRIVYCYGYDEDAHPRLWRSDGTRSGTIPLAPEATFPAFDPITAAVAGGRLFFSGCTPEDSCQLWTSDGTPDGTARVRDVRFPFSVALEDFTAVGRLVYFRAGNELWRTDGTAGGTVRLQTFSFNRPRLLTAAGNRLFLVADIDRDGLELWVSDGTPAGTRALTRFAPVLPFDGAAFLKPFGNRVYFVADDGRHGEELWVSDGTPAGTRQLTDFANTQAFVPLHPEELREVAGRVVFPANDGHSRRLLWAVPATAVAAPPVRLCSAEVCPEIPQPNHLVPAGGRLVFQGQDATRGREPWATDGTPQGTRRLADLCPGACSSLELPPAAAGGAAFLVATPRPSGRAELWRSDGTPAGIRRFADPQVEVQAPLEIAALGPRVFFAAGGGDGVELWTSTGQAGSTRVVADLVRAPAGSFPRELRAVGERLVFLARGDRGFGLWGTAGTAGSTVRLLSNDGSDGCAGGLGNLTVAGGLVYLWCGTALWRTDGTAAGTERLAELLPPVGPAPPLAALADRVLFGITTAVSTPEGSQERGELWVSDGTPAGTRRFLTLPDDAQIREVAAAAGSEVFFTTYQPIARQLDLWRTDGTAGGTRRLTGERLGSRPVGFARLGSQVLFVAETEDGPFNLALWRADATTVSRVGDLPAGATLNPFPPPLVAYRGAVYLLASNFFATGLYRSDGAAGLQLVREFLPEPLPAVADELVVYADRLYFPARDDEHGRELWQSDGTAEGTTLLRDLGGDPSSRPADLTVAGGRLFFSAFDRAQGLELWQTDGTADGTRLVQDLAPGGAWSLPGRLTAAPGRLYFSADDGTVGQELWVLPLAAAGCQPAATRLCLNGGRFQVEVAWRDAAGGGAGQAVPLTGDTGTFWFFSPSNVELVVKVLDARALDGHFWVFYGALSNVEYTLTVTDTQTGAARRYLNPAGQMASVGDTRAFGPQGAFAQTAVATLTAPGAPLLVSERSDPAARAACQPGPRTLCLNGGRFAVGAAWKDFQGGTGTGTAVGLTGDTGYFWFFDPANVEVVLKVLDGRALNGKFWVLYGALSNVEYTLTVTDSETGTVRTYTNPRGRFASAADSGAF